MFDIIIFISHISLELTIISRFYPLVQNKSTAFSCLPSIAYICGKVQNLLANLVRNSEDQTTKSKIANNLGSQ